MTERPQYATGGLVTGPLMELMGEQGCCWRWAGPASTSSGLVQFSREFAVSFGAGVLLDEAAMWRDPITPDQAREMAVRAYDDPDA
ncbi:MAG TPA: hypothetical protein VFQ42_04115 [Mycobacterium sp.]|nr:hypothetical protein [Mycobacterium sp.]